MTKQPQSDLSELETLKGIRIAISDDGQSFFIGFSFRRKPPGEKTLCLDVLDGCSHPLRRLWADLMVGGDVSATGRMKV
jgi:hypothetical protein